LFFVSAISQLPTSSRDCVDCYRDPTHPVCSSNTTSQHQQPLEENQLAADRAVPVGGDHLRSVGAVLNEDSEADPSAEGSLHVLPGSFMSDLHAGAGGDLQIVAEGGLDAGTDTGEDQQDMETVQQLKYKTVCQDLIQKPKHFQISGKDVWVEKTPGNVRAARPLVIAQQRETHKNVQELVQKFLEDQLVPLTHFSASGQETKQQSPNLRNPFIMVASLDGKIVPFSADISFSAMDNKLVQTLTGTIFWLNIWVF
jgi:hypothetical protein